MEFVDFLSSQIEKLGVRVELKTEVTAARLESYNPDRVILATGSTPLIPRIKGIDRRNVVTAEDVLGQRVEVGSSVVVLGGGQVGCEVAAFLAEKGKKVVLVEMLELLAQDLGKRQGRQCLIDYLMEKGVTLLTQMKGEEITESGLVGVDRHGQRRTIKGDTVVLACGSVPDTDLLEKLKGIVPEIDVAGDCFRPRSILEAIDEATRIGRLI
jgi:pyruvate/2-oxoglutarate dehydrogenase complex dihydrolipoamide dehydrogenase (E3) component